MMRFGSLFSGIEAASVAWEPLGWQCRWVAEIDPFACAVLAHHYPHVPIVGDVTAQDWCAYRGQCDLVVAGPPCQDHSVAGNRAGLSGERGNLSLIYADILDAIDPVWSLTENVPGWLSLGDNAFGNFLGRLVGANAPLVPGRGQRWTDAGVVAGPRRTAAWRILDAQYFGLAQRRERVFVVAVRGSGNWRCAEALFPFRTGLRGDTAPRREEGQRIARPVASCPENGSGYRNDADTAENLIGFDARQSDGLLYGDRAGPLDTNGCSQAVAFNNTGQGWWNEDEAAASVRKGDDNGNGGSHGRQDFESETFVLRSDAPRDGVANCEPAIVAHTLRGDGFDAGEDGTGRGTPLIPIQYAEQLARDKRQNGMGFGEQDGPMFTLERRQVHGIASPRAVRRLTPRECERLQGFPDDWTAIQYRGKPAADGPRYRALGNSMAIPVVAWIGDRIRQFEALKPQLTTMAAE